MGLKNLKYYVGSIISAGIGICGIGIAFFKGVSDGMYNNIDIIGTAYAVSPYIAGSAAVYAPFACLELKKKGYEGRAFKEKIAEEIGYEIGTTTAAIGIAYGAGQILARIPIL